MQAKRHALQGQATWPISIKPRALAGKTATVHFAMSELQQPTRTPWYRGVPYVWLSIVTPAIAVLAGSITLAPAISADGPTIPRPSPHARSIRTAMSSQATLVERETRATMKQIFQAMRVLLPISENDMRDPAKEKEMRFALQLLADNAKLLFSHAEDETLGFRYLSASLARYAREASRHYNLGNYGSTKLFLQRATDFCIACHSRLPSPGDSPLAKDFIAASELAKLPAAERASLAVATRRFDTALTIYEKLFSDPDAHAVDLLTPLTDYLIVSIRIKGDLVRPVRTLEHFARRPDIWQNLRSDLGHWVQTLRALRIEAQQPPTLERARKLLDAREQGDTFAADRRMLIHYLLASSVLHRYLESHAFEGQRAPELAQAYYLVGLTESRIGRDFWISQASQYLESAIRLAPKQAFARRAYALLEEDIVLSYSGSSGVSLPEDVVAHLTQLRQLIDAP